MIFCIFFKIAMRTCFCNSTNDKNESLCYQIVGEDEADVNENKISVTSPIARALIGKHEGDSVEVRTPQGVVVYEVLEVSYI